MIDKRKYTKRKGPKEALVYLWKTLAVRPFGGDLEKSENGRGSGNCEWQRLLFENRGKLITDEIWSIEISEI